MKFKKIQNVVIGLHAFYHKNCLINRRRLHGGCYPNDVRFHVQSFVQSLIRNFLNFGLDVGEDTGCPFVQIYFMDLRVQNNGFFINVCA